MSAHMDMLKPASAGVGDSATVMSVSELHFTYPNGLTVLHGAELQLVAGHTTGLLGANGSGKSTLLGAVANAIEGERRLTIDVAPDAVWPIGYATQEIALYPHLSVTENLTHAARLATGRWRVAEHVSQAIDEYDLGGIRDTQARFLSGGQRRIVHLACSFVHRPTIRLLDEPTTSLDFATRQLLIELVASWSNERIATLVTAHYPEDIEELCSTITVLVEGHTYRLGSLQDYLGTQRRLGRVEQRRADGTVCRTELAGPLLSLADVMRAAADNGLDHDSEVCSLEVKPPGLRDLLRRDPSLRRAIEDEGTAP